MLDLFLSKMENNNMVSNQKTMVIMTRNGNKEKVQILSLFQKHGKAIYQ